MGNPEGARVPEEQRLGPVLRRREQVQPGTTDQRLLDTEGDSEWVHTDPWRVMRIQSEFVEGFGALAELPSAISVFGSARTPAGGPEYEAGVRIGKALVEAGFAVITGGGPGAMEAANKGAREAKGSRSVSASSCPSSPASTRTSTSASTSGTSSSARRCS